jgi:predicted transcriptional regulator
MKRIKEILFGIEKGTTVDALARELNMNESFLRAMIEFSVDREYLREIDTQHGCMDCLRSSKYSTKCYSESTKMYALTSKGLKLISSSNID